MKKFLSMVLGSILLFGCQSWQGTKEVQGTLILGHEVRAFRDSQDNKEYWLIDKTGKLMAKYQEIIGSETPRYQPVKTILKVEYCSSPQDGFGAEYDGCYEVKEIISLLKGK